MSAAHLGTGQQHALLGSVLARYLVAARSGTVIDPVERIWGALETYLVNSPTLTMAGRLRQVHASFRHRTRRPDTAHRRAVQLTVATTQLPTRPQADRLSCTCGWRRPVVLVATAGQRHEAPLLPGCWMPARSSGLGPMEVPVRAGRLDVPTGWWRQGLLPSERPRRAAPPWDHRGHPRPLRPAPSVLIRPAGLRPAEPGRAGRRPAQAVPPHRHPLREAGRQLPGLGPLAAVLGLAMTSCGRSNSRWP